MESIGSSLRETREQLGLTLDEVERATRIRTHHLLSLEQGDFDSLPSSVQARGFIRNYAEFLGLNPDDLLSDYAELLRTNHQRRKLWSGSTYEEPATLPTVQVRSRRARWFSMDVLVAALVAVAILAVVIWGLGRVMENLRGGASETDSIADFLVPTLTPSPVPSQDLAITPQAAEVIEVVGPSETPTLALPLLSDLTGLINLQLIAEKRSWLYVIVDGVEEFRGRAIPGTVLEFQGDEVIEISTGNAGGLHVFLNGQDQGRMGELGQVIVRLWTLSGVVTPTPTETGTPTPAPTATQTPRFIPTPQSTPGPNSLP
jgi:cytoskeleton protein RodZ